MAGTLTSPCPACGTDIQPTWQWCQACGYDPEGRADEETEADLGADLGAERRADGFAHQPNAARHERRRAVPTDDAPAGNSTIFYVAIVVVSLVLAAAVFLRARTNATEVPESGPATSVIAPSVPWAVFNPPNEGFKVELPGNVTTQPPQKGTMGGTETTVHGFTSASGPTTVGVTYADLGSAATAAPDTLLPALLQEAADSLGGSVQSSQRIEVDGRPALDYVIDIRGATKNQGRILIDGSRVYTLNVIGPAPRQADVDHLVKSFVIG